MQFKDYVNKISNSNRIYTKREIREMKLKDFFDKKKELLSQYDAIGLPKPDELKNSPNVNYVEDPNEVFGGRWESVGVNDGTVTAQPQGFSVSAGKKGFGGITGGAAPIQTGKTQVDYINPPKMSAELNNKVITKQDPTSKTGVWSNAQKSIAANVDNEETEMQYYGHSIRLAENKEPSDFMKKNNDFYKISDISDPIVKNYYIEKARNVYKLEQNDPDLYNKVKDMQVVIPKKGSQLYSQIINSGVFQDWVAKAYLDLTANKSIADTTLLFPPNYGVDRKALSRTIHIADMLGTKLNADGSMTTRLLDGYDFKYMNKKDKVAEGWRGPLIKAINNSAYAQQENQQLNNYLISALFTIAAEDIQKYVENYKKRYSLQ